MQCGNEVYQEIKIQTQSEEVLVSFQEISLKNKTNLSKCIKRLIFLMLN